MMVVGKWRITNPPQRENAKGCEKFFFYIEKHEKHEVGKWRIIHLIKHE